MRNGMQLTSDVLDDSNISIFETKPVHGAWIWSSPARMDRTGVSERYM
jgi:hypothetical protein